MAFRNIALLIVFVRNGFATDVADPPTPCGVIESSALVVTVGNGKQRAVRH